MKLVWTYDSEILQDNIIKFYPHNLNTGHVENRKLILLNYYIHSITKAKELGYYTIIYCNALAAKYFEGVVDEIIIVGKYEDTPLWDGQKMYPIEHRTDEFCLLDGDVILNKRLPEFKTDIVFDTLEVGNWEADYKETIIKLDTLGIGEIIPEWNPTKILIANCGILYINNSEFKKRYIDGWKTFNNFIKLHLHEVNTLQATSITSQFFLTLLINETGVSNQPLSEKLGHNNGYYTHFAGRIKFKKPISKYNSYIAEKENKKQNLM
jgi:hypothetical protein